MRPISLPFSGAEAEAETCFGCQLECLGSKDSGGGALMTSTERSPVQIEYRQIAIFHFSIYF